MAKVYKDLARRRGLSRTYRVPKGAAKNGKRYRGFKSDMPTYGRGKPSNPFLSRSPKVVASSSRQEALPAVEELGFDFKPLTERMRRRHY
jgi:hypothetical protein